MNGSKLTLSVIMPTYNRADVISESINSVFEQDWDGDIELIVIDDCSTDGTASVLQSLNHEKLNYIQLDKNVGGAAARNIGIKKSTGNVIAFIDSDTIWYKNKISKQIDYLKSDNVVFCSYRKQRNHDWIIPNSIEKSGFLFDDLIYQNFVDTPSVIMMKRILESVGGFDESLPRFQDWDLFMRLAKKFEFYHVNEVLFDSLTLDGSISSNDLARLNALHIIFEKNKDHILDSKKIKMRFFYKFVNACVLLGDYDFLVRVSSDFGFFYKAFSYSLSFFPKLSSIYRWIRKND